MSPNDFSLIFLTKYQSYDSLVYQTAFLDIIPDGWGIFVHKTAEELIWGYQVRNNKFFIKGIYFRRASVSMDFSLISVLCRLASDQIWGKAFLYCHLIAIEPESIFITRCHLWRLPHNAQCEKFLCEGIALDHGDTKSRIIHRQI